MRANRLCAPRIEQGNQGAKEPSPGNCRRDHRNENFHQIRRIKPIANKMPAVRPAAESSAATISQTASPVTELRLFHLREQQRDEKENHEHYANHQDVELICVENDG